MARIVIIGSGFSGICLAIQLQKAGFDGFTILEKTDRVGGTWRDNTYPGAACDTPSFSYCFSFEQKTDWSRKWSPQSEILAYLEHCARKYDLYPHIRFGSEVSEARFDETTAAWTVRTTDGAEIEADVLVSGVGQLNRPWTPPIPGLEDFAGPRFHSARWQHDVDLGGREVAVIGNAASAIQFIPEIAPRAKRLRIFQRSANWMLPRGNRPFRVLEKQIFERVPGAAWLYRSWIWLMHELRFPAIQGDGFLSRRITEIATKNMESQIDDPELRGDLTPDYPIGGKRVLISDDYYATLARDDVEVVQGEIERISTDAVIDSEGRRWPADVLIVATGFETTSFLAPMKIQGRDGRWLNDAWGDGAEAYLGMSVAGFPNLFLMYGPNTNLGHNSIIFMLECQTAYIIDCLRQMGDRGLRSLEVRADVMAAYNQRLQDELADSSWARTAKSWYKTGSGRITNNWSGPTIAYWWRTRHADLAEYLCDEG